MKIALLWVGRLMLLALVWFWFTSQQRFQLSPVGMTFVTLFVFCPAIASFMYPRFAARLSAGLAILGSAVVVGLVVLALAAGNRERTDSFGSIGIALTMVLWIPNALLLLISGALLHLATRTPATRTEPSPLAESPKARSWWI